MVSLKVLEEQYRVLIAQMEQSEAAIARQDLDTVEACAHRIEQVLATLAQTPTQLERAGEESAWERLTDAMRHALARTEQNRAQIQHWITQTKDALSHISRGGRAVNGYAASGTPVGAEFLSARG